MDEPTAALTGVEVERLFAVAAVAARRRRGDPVHLAPLRGDHRAVPAGHDHARRPARLHRPGRRRSPSTRWSAGWSAATSTRCSPSRTSTPGDVVLEVDGLTRERRLRATSRFDGPRRRDRRAGRAGRRRPLRGGPGRVRRRPAATPARSASHGKTLQARLTARRDGRRHGAGPGGPPPAGPGHGRCRSSAT